MSVKWITKKDKNGKIIRYSIPWYDYYSNDLTLGVGPGAAVGTLWMKSVTDNNWYSVNLIGTSGSVVQSASLYINQTPLTWVSPGGQDFGYQLLLCGSDNTVHQIYLSGVAGSISMSVNQNNWYNPRDYKPNFLLQSITDNYFYIVSLVSGSYFLRVDQNSKMWPFPDNVPIPIPQPPVSKLTWDQQLITPWEQEVVSTWDQIIG